MTVDIGGMLGSLSEAEYGFVVPAVVAYLVSVFFRALRWRLLLAHMKPIGVQRLYPVVVVGYMANNLLPMRMGELVRSHFLGEREGVSKATALMTIIIERIFDALTLLMFISVTALFVPLGGLIQGLGEKSSVPWPLLLGAVSLPFLCGFGVLLVLANSPNLLIRPIGTLFQVLPLGVGRRLFRLGDLFLDGLHSLRNPVNMVQLLALSVPIWLFETVLFYMIGLSFGLQDVYGSLVEMAVAMVLVMAISNIGSSVPATPGGLGLFELVARETMMLLPLSPVDRALAGGFVAVVHASLLLPMIVLGQLFLWRQHLSLNALSGFDNRQHK